MIHPNIFMLAEGSGDILNHRGARAHRDTDQMCIIVLIPLFVS